MASSATLPVGSPITLPIRPDQVRITEGNEQAPVYSEDAAATLVWENYQRAKNYVETNAWLLEWQETDILYQSPIYNRFLRAEPGRPARVPRFLVAKFARTLARAVKRGLFAEQVPFMLRPQGKTTQEQADAWTALLAILLRRMKFQYHGGLQINCQTLQGTGAGKYGWDERTIIKRTRRRKTQPARIAMPAGGEREIPTKESDEFEEHEDKVTESWPFYEYRRLGTTLFDPKWCTPDEPEESAGYCIDVDYVYFSDLQEMRQLSCFREVKDKSGKVISPGIPPEEDLINYFFSKGGGSAPSASAIEDSMTTQGSAVTHAEGRNKQTDVSPLKQPLLLLEQWDPRTVKTVLCYDGRKLTIRNEEHHQGSMSHTATTWWPIDNSGYGMGIGRINGADQRVAQGVLNECLKMIAYPFNAPILHSQGDNAPTQNTIARHGGYQAVNPGPSGDVRKAMAFMEMPGVPADAWRMMEFIISGAEQLSGADAQMQQGIPSRTQGATRSAAGANRLAAMSDQNIADPVDSFANGVIIPVVNFLIHMVKTKMPLKEIRDLLSAKHAAVILKAIDQEQFLAAEFEVSVLAGQKLAAKQGIQQLLPLFLQIVQQPGIMDAYHQIGRTVSLPKILDTFLEVSELQSFNADDFFPPMTPEEKAHYAQVNPGAQKIAAETAVENVKGANKQKEIRTKGETDLANKAAELAIQRISDGIPLTRAAGLLERTQDEHTLSGGLPDQMEQ